MIKKKSKKKTNRSRLMASNKPRGDAQPVMRMPDGTLAPIPFGPADARTARGRA